MRDTPSQPHLSIPPSSSAVSIMTSSHSSNFISQINLQNSTEILCVLIAPVKTSEILPSAWRWTGQGWGMLSRDWGTAGRPGSAHRGARPPPAPTQPHPGPSPDRGLSAVCPSVGAPSDLRPTKYPSSPGNSAGAVLRHRDRGPCLLPLVCPSVPEKPPSPGVPDAAAAGLGGPSPPCAAPGYSRAAGSSLGDNPSRPMSPSSMAQLVRGSGEPGARDPGEGVTSACRLQGPGSSAGGDSPPPPPQTQDAKPRARAGSQTWPPWRTTAPLLPLGFLGWGSRDGLLPPGLPADTALAPPRGHPDTERARGTLETNSRRARPAGPACASPPLCGRVSTGSGPSYQSGWPVGP